MSRSWLIGGAIYTLVIVAAVLVRFSAWGHVPEIVYSAAVMVSDFGTLPPYFAGVGVYVGIDLALVLQDMTGLPDSHPLLTSVAWLATTLSAAVVAVADVYLARWGWRLFGATCRRGDRSSRVSI